MQQDPEDQPERPANPAEKDCPASLELLVLQAMQVMEHLARRASLDSLELRAFLEVRERQEEATLGPPGTEESLETRVSLAYPEHPVSLERKVQTFPAPSPESLENPVTLVSPDDQVIKGSLVPVETMGVPVLMDLKEKEESRVTEDNQDHKDSRAPEEIPVSQALPQLVTTVLAERTECPVSLDQRVCPERCWGPRLGPPGPTASPELPETRASLGLPEDLAHPVWMGVLECPV